MRTLEEIANDPRLDDEGTYDYLAEDLPQDSSTWGRGRYCKCDECGKTRYWTRTDRHYFYCWDGWDSLSYNTCWVCDLQSRSWWPTTIARRLTRKHRQRQKFRETYHKAIKAGVKPEQAKKISKNIIYGGTN